MIDKILDNILKLLLVSVLCFSGYFLYQNIFAQQNNSLEAVSSDECVEVNDSRYYYQSCSHNVREALGMVNQKRLQVGSEPLVVNDILGEISSNKAQHFALVNRDASTINTAEFKDAYRHTSANEVIDNLYKTKEFSLNTNGFMTLDQVFSILTSEENDLYEPLYSNQFSEIGVGMYYNKENNSNYWHILLN